MTEPSSLNLVGVGIPTLQLLRGSVLSGHASGTAVVNLREAGFAGGEAVYSAFERWLSETRSDGGESAGVVDPGTLPLEEFGLRAAEFFRNAGWGNVTFAQNDDEGVAIVDIEDCWEGTAADDAGTAGCHVTTGLLAAFFGRVAGYPVAVLETECCEGEGSRCRFMMGNAEVMNYKWQQLR